MTSLAQTNQMPAPKVGKRPKTGGRKKGTPNKPSQFLMHKLQEVYGPKFDPIVRAAEAAVELHAVAMETRTVADLTAAVGAWDRVAQYCTPKLKSISVETDNKAVRQIRDVTINVVSTAESNGIERATQQLIKDIN
jgi:hypothetical protein